MAIYLGNQKVSVKGGLPVEVIEEVGEQVDFTLANATESEVLSGKTFYAQDSTLKTGTLEMPSSGENKLAQVVDGTITEITASDLQGITSIRQRAFSNCKNLVSVELPNTLTALPAYCFESCAKLKTIIIPDSVISMGSEAFDNCTVLGSVYYVGTIDEWTNIEFIDNVFANPLNNGADLYINNEKVTNATISKVNNCVFAGCTSLESVTIGNSATSIGGYAFYNCINLPSIIIPDSVTTMGMYAFYGCTTLQSVTIGNGVTRIDNYALYMGSSTAKATITMLRTTPPTIQSRTIGNYVEKIIVPQGTLSAYQSATNWSRWASIMEEATE